MQRARDTAYGLTLIWSLVAVYGSQPESKAVKAASLVCIVVTCLFTILSVLRRRSPREVEQAAADIRQPLNMRESLPIVSACPPFNFSCGL